MYRRKYMYVSWLYIAADVTVGYFRVHVFTISRVAKKW